MLNTHNQFRTDDLHLMCSMNSVVFTINSQYTYSYTSITVVNLQSLLKGPLTGTC